MSLARSFCALDSTLEYCSQPWAKLNEDGGDVF